MKRLALVISLILLAPGIAMAHPVGYIGPPVGIWPSVIGWIRSIWPWIWS